MQTAGTQGRGGRESRGNYYTLSGKGIPSPLMFMHHCMDLTYFVLVSC